jgi:hypothetical protein
MAGMRIRSFVGRWRIAGIVALVGAAMAVAILWSSDQSVRADNQSHVLRALATDMHEQSANEWRVIAEGSISADLNTAIEATWGEIESAIGGLHPATAEDVASVQVLSGLVARYRSAMSAEFDLVVAGEIARAKEVDAAQVDPVFAEIDSQVLLREADAAMYSAKQSGPGHWYRLDD